MVPPFDIFKADSSGSPVWVEAASELEEAKARVHQLMKDCPCEYFIFSQATGRKISIEPVQHGP
jgi:hypothetical protein